MKNFLIRLLACVLVLTMLFAFAACKDETTGDDDDDKAPVTGDDDEDPGDDPWIDDDPIDWGDDDDDDVCIACVDENGDLKCDVCGSDVEPPYNPWDDVGYFAVPNTAATISLIKIADRLGSFTSENGFVAGADAAIAEITNVELVKGSAVSIEYDYTGAASNSGVLLGVNAAEGATAWDANTPAIFVYIANDGTARIAKVTADGVTDIATSATPVYTAGATAKVVATWDGANAVSVKVGDADALTATVDFADAGLALGLRAGATGVKYENVKISLSGTALEFETRFGGEWRVIEGGEHDGALYTSYKNEGQEGASALGYKTLAIIGNIDFTGASKITLTAKVANGAEWRTRTEEGTWSGNQNYGFIMNVQNDDEYSPLFWEDAKACSYFYIYMPGSSAGGVMGKFGKTKFEKTYYNANDGWYGLPGNTKNVPKDENGNLLDDGTPDECTITNGTIKTTFAFGKYNELKVEWDKENLVLTGWLDGQEFRKIEFTINPFVNDGDGVGLRTNSGDVYFAEMSVEVE